MKKLKLELDKYESIIFANEEIFKKTFCHEDTMDINAVYFNTENIKIDYILCCGQHISETVKIELLKKWIDNYELLE